MRAIAIHMPRVPTPQPGDSVLAWTTEDQNVLEFRYRSRYTPHDERFADFVAYGLMQDVIDAQIMLRAVISCNTLRDIDRMRTDWLIEECAPRHTLEKDIKKA